MLNKKATQTISIVLLKEDLDKIIKLLTEYNKRYNTNYSRSDFIREAIHHEILTWED